jgi:8-oxo-dGTP diphosphatase
MTEATIEVVAAVISRSDRILLCQRHDEDHLPLHWEFPGGKIEAGEEPEQALAREIQEELGVTGRVFELLDSVRHDYPEKSVRIRFYRASLDGEPLPRVHRDLAWFGREQLAQQVVPPPNAVVIRRLLAGELDIH